MMSVGASGVISVASNVRPREVSEVTRRALAGVVAVFAAHAVVSELVQHTFYTGRTGDPLDVLADGVGTAVGALVGSAVLRRVATGARAGAAADVVRAPVGAP